MRMKLRGVYLLIFFTVVRSVSFAQDSSEINNKIFSFHWQATIIPQYHFNFKALYTGANSLLPSEPVKASFTTTFFLTYKPFKHTYITFDPEAAGGKGLSKTLGIAGFPNGEIYRVGNPAPSPFIARLYVEQRFSLSSEKEIIDDDQNQIKEKTNTDYISIIVGKFSLTDFFDASQISHDPRTQFLNWSLMASGAWDYPANTRGYDFGAIVQLHYHNWAFKYANMFMPTEANGSHLEWKGLKAMGMVWELGKTNIVFDSLHTMNFHAGLFWNKARMGNYKQSIKNDTTGIAPNITDSREYGRSKWGFYFYYENNIKWLHQFIKSSWNDGQNESWAFTEIDRSFSTGLSFDGIKWKRKNDHAGIAYVINNISNSHKDYLAKGGYGFLIGDGKLNYSAENIIELYYSYNILNKIFISPDYQFIWNPAYNKDRGPVHIISLRLHIEL